MSNFAIFTDSACDLSPELLAQWQVRSVSLNFRFVGNDTLYSDNDMTSAEFYAQMREGKIAKTSAVNSETFAQEFEKALKEGNDVLYVGFSSGLSNTYNAGRLAAEALKDAYPDRKILTVDTLCASAGEGLLLRFACDKRDAGATIEETLAHVETLRPRLAHWFTVDDLDYLKRGGRVSPAVAFVGNMLGIKPVLHVDDEGHLIKRDTVRGRKKAVAALAQKMVELEADVENYPIYISHADCIADAEYLAGLIKTQFGKDVAVITNVGTVIGAHSGPGTLALFFVAKNR
jgi:DegV family protein with EDD domain